MKKCKCKYKFKLFISILLLMILPFLISGCGNKNSENMGSVKNDIDYTRTSITKDSKENVDNPTNQKNNSNNNNTNNSDNSTEQNNKESELSSFSTPLKSGVQNRITNIKLTCNKINEKVIKQGETFSFNQIVGPCTAEEGYKKAEIYVNKKIQFALGGGNCQVSTTLYNAALAVPGIDITERHEHNGRPVDYIEDGKDATVSYNTLDLKFVNNTDSDIKLYTWCDDVNVCAKICKL